ncbi:immune inhibitor A domain-containing protein [Anoxybacteroides tepidamans]|uniref:immune inhibitor A domain-containing protein n=1 Tax=Anoxybacteroides tepidamans TaxID=265948 RepID=UPI0004848DDF|nr:immune inhibitor A domain-containing protein [Anoxybacillus tepidamans]
MKKLLKTSLSTAFFAGTLFASFPGGYANISAQELLHKNPSHFSYSHSSLDLAIVNDEKLLDSLIKRGVIPANATAAEKQKALRSYLEFKGKQQKTADADPLAGKAKAAEAKKQKKLKEFSNGLTKGKGNKYGQLRPDPVVEGSSPGVAKKGKLLTLLVEFSDVKHNSIKPNETDNYYPDYNTEHFRAMIFGNKGEFKGPNGEELVSQKQYYEEQSGGTYTIEGNVYGWLQVPGTAAYYGADRPDGGHDNVNPGGAKQLVVDAYKAALAAGIPLEEYDKEDPHDLDGDGNYWEPDGLVDHLQIIHAGMGQEAGGGSLGDNAIWSHRSAKYYDPDGLGKGKPGFYDYTMMPEDGATGVFAHEYGHDLGLPDEYDTLYSGAGEAIGYWSIMASGSWAGKIPGAEPTGFSPWAKQYFQSTLGGKWTNPTVINWEDITADGQQFLLDQANSPLGQNNQAIRINLPQKKTPINTPAKGSYEYWGGQGDEMDNSMVVDLDLTGKTSATLTFDAWYDIEEQWDFAFVQVSADGGQTWKSLGNDHTRSDVVSEGYPTIIDSMPGFTGNSNGWQAQTFDLSAYAGKKIKLRLRYATDWGTSYNGFFVDNLKVTADGETLLDDGAENAASPFTFNGFTRMDGNKLTDHYYLLEWRNHQGVDTGLAHIKRGNSLMSYDGGLVVWYVDDSFTDNWTGIHPGEGYLGVVDSHLGRDLVWNTGAEASTRYHIADAAFGLNPTSVLDINYPTEKLHAPSQKAASLFDDSSSFENPFMPDAGRKVPHYGLKVKVKAQAKDKSVGLIEIYK